MKRSVIGSDLLYFLFFLWPTMCLAQFLDSSQIYTLYYYTCVSYRQEAQVDLNEPSAPL